MIFTQLGILGVTGTGKSFLTAEIINHLCKSENRIIIIDDLYQIAGNLEYYFTPCYTLEEFIYQIIDKKEFRLIVSLENDSEYYEIFSVLWQLNNMILVIDELSLYCDPFTLPESLRHLTQRGRLRNISLIWNTQRPANVSRNISSQNEFIISFKLNEVSDLKYFYFDRSKIDQIRNLSLEKHEYMLVRGNEKRLTKRLKNMKFHLTF